MKFLEKSLCIIAVLAHFPAQAFDLISQDFTHMKDIPKIHACQSKGGSNLSPALSWKNAPTGTHSYALIVDDEDAPCRKGDGACRHWMVYNIPAQVSAFKQGEDLLKQVGLTQGRTYAGRNEYDGPCPPGPHSYTFTIFALKEGVPKIDNGTPMTRSQFAKEFSSFILDKADLKGNYSPW